MPFCKEREYRSMMLATANQITMRTPLFESAYYVSGYAARFEPYVLFVDDEGPIYERFERGCFDGTDMSDVILQFDHCGRVYARQSNNTLKLLVDDEGLFIGADLSSTNGSKALYEDIAAGLITKMSWAYIPDRWYYDKASRTIVNEHIEKIYDVSAVSLPANDSTSINARALIDGEIERVKQELRSRAKKKLQLLLKLELEEEK